MSIPTREAGARTGTAGLFVISAATLTLEVLQTRIFAYSLNPFLLYAAITIAMLGFGASGTLLACWQGWRRYRIGSVGAFGAAGFAISLVWAHFLFARVSIALSQHDVNLLSALVFGSLALPYVFAGIAVTACLASAGRGVHLTYLLNLVGSAVGCFLVYPLLKPLGASALVAGVGVLVVLAGFVFARSGCGRFAKVMLVLAAITVAVPCFAPQTLYPFRPDPAGQLPLLQRYIAAHPEEKVKAELVLGTWDPTGRVEFHSFEPWKVELPEPLPFLFYSQDGDAGSVLFCVGDDIKRAAGLFERTLYGAPYKIHGGTAPKVLIIGLGGGPDVLGALYNGASSVIGVDINKSVIDALKGPLAELCGNLYSRPGVSTVHMDGRTFVRAFKDDFDILVMTGADTKQSLAAGSLAISQNGLYTVDAFNDYLDRLRPGGVLTVLRFGEFDQLRLSSIGVAMLRARGIEKPERHFMVLEQNVWSSVTICLDPITPETVSRIKKWFATIPSPDTGVRIPVYDVMPFALNHSPQMLWPCAADARTDPARSVTRFFDAVTERRESEFIDAYKAGDISPTTDDRPFYFDIQRKDELLSNPMLHYRWLAGFLAIMAAFAVISIAAPVPFLMFRKERPPFAGLVRTLVYFLSLGAGFMIIEIGFMQKLVVLLGHQSYTVTVVLATVLASAGLGSAASSRFAGAVTVRRYVVPAIAVLSLALFFALDLWGPLIAPLSLNARIAVVAAGLFPLGFVLGIPFPSGLATLSERAPTLVPWAIAANGFASVVGSAIALPGAMILGYRNLLVVGLALYLVAAFTFPFGSRRSSQ